GDRRSLHGTLPPGTGFSARPEDVVLGFLLSTDLSSGSLAGAVRRRKARVTLKPRRLIAQPGREATPRYPFVDHVPDNADACMTGYGLLRVFERVPGRIRRRLIISPGQRGAFGESEGRRRFPPGAGPCYLRYIAGVRGPAVTVGHHQSWSPSKGGPAPSSPRPGSGGVGQSPPSSPPPSSPPSSGGVGSPVSPSSSVGSGGSVGSSVVSSGLVCSGCGTGSGAGAWGASCSGSGASPPPQTGSGNCSTGTPSIACSMKSFQISAEVEPP